MALLEDSRKVSRVLSNLYKVKGNRENLAGVLHVLNSTDRFLTIHEIMARLPFRFNYQQVERVLARLRTVAGLIEELREPARVKLNKEMMRFLLSVQEGTKEADLLPYPPIMPKTTFEEADNEDVLWYREIRQVLARRVLKGKELEIYQENYAEHCAKYMFSEHPVGQVREIFIKVYLMIQIKKERWHYLDTLVPEGIPDWCTRQTFVDWSQVES